MPKGRFRSDAAVIIAKLASLRFLGPVLALSASGSCRGKRRLLAGAGLIWHACLKH